jgi:putative flippase GtrA
LGVGVVNTAVSFAVFHGLVAALPTRRGGPAIAQAGATAAAMACSYALNRAWTFRSGSARAPEIARFLAQQALMLAASTLLLEVAIDGLGARPTPSWLVITAGLAAVNYLAQRRFVFRSAADGATAGA